MSVYEDYFNWLYDETELPKEGENSYILLCSELYGREFKIHGVDDDLNRIEDGIEWRYSFIEEFDLDPFVVSEAIGPVNFLEVLMGITDRLAFMSEGSYHIYTEAGWLMELFRNTGLYYYSDIIFHEHEKSVDEISKILDKIERRTYSHNGVGGLFPLIESRVDMRRATLWEQMHTYLIDRVF